jgi:predicted ester cyclase
MSTDGNKLVVKQLLEGFNDRDWDSVRELFSPDYVNHNPPGVTPDRDGQLEAMRGLVASFSDIKAEATHVVAEGDTVVVRDVVRGKHDGDFAGAAATGNNVEATFIHVYRIENGKIAERWGLADVLALMEQVGAFAAA